jgi:hypothetical protein
MYCLSPKSFDKTLRIIEPEFQLLKLKGKNFVPPIIQEEFCTSDDPVMPWVVSSSWRIIT